LPAQSFSGPSPLVLATIFYCLRFETSLFIVPNAELVLLGVECLLLINSVNNRLELVVSGIPEAGTNYKRITSNNSFDKYVDIFENVALHLLYEKKVKYRVVFRNYEFARVLLD
jgi:hypothetical protein